VIRGLEGMEGRRAVIKENAHGVCAGAPHIRIVEGLEESVICHELDWLVVEVVLGKPHCWLNTAILISFYFPRV
jgi:hypothetical protein